jgi:putative lipoic acid-binding regulatory protein
MKGIFMKRLLVPSLFSIIALSACGPGMSDQVQLRVAHLSPDAPDVKVCVKLSSAANFTGVAPLTATALKYGQVTAPVSVAAGSYDIRIVGDTATNCDAKLSNSIGDFNNNALTAGSSVTVAAVGFVTKPNGNDNGFTLKAYADDATKPGSADTKLRIIHTAPAIDSVSVGLLDGTTFTELAGNLTYGNKWTPTGVNAQGYATLPKLVNKTIVVRPTGTQTNAITLGSISTNGADIFTGWAIGGGAKPPQVLLCEESAAAVSGLTKCTAIPVTPTAAN